MDSQTFLSRYYTQKKVDLGKYFCQGQLYIVGKLVGKIKNEKCTCYEFEIIAYKHYRYYIDRSEMTNEEMKNVLSLKDKEVKIKEYNEIMKKIEEIYNDIF